MPAIEETRIFLSKSYYIKDKSFYESRVTKKIERVINKLKNVDSEEHSYLTSRVLGIFRDYNSYASDIYLTDISEAKNNNNSTLCSVLATSIACVACDNFNTNPNWKDSYTEVLSCHGEWWLLQFACGYFDLIPHCYPQIIKDFQSGRIKLSTPAREHEFLMNPQRLGVLAFEMMAREHKQTLDWASAGIPVDPFYLRFCQEALYSEDEALVAEWLTELCNKHLEWTAGEMGHNEYSNLMGYEIELPVL